ncbi:hypothetical protein [Lactococcus garvieae]
MAVSNTSREVNSVSNPYRHTGVIGTVKGGSFITYEQNVGGVQIV